MSEEKKLKDEESEKANGGKLLNRSDYIKCPKCGSTYRRGTAHMCR